MKTCMVAILLFLYTGTTQALYQGQDLSKTETGVRETTQDNLPSKRQINVHIEGLCLSIEDYVRFIQAVRNKNIDQLNAKAKQKLVDSIQSKRNRMRHFVVLILRDTARIANFPKDHPIALTASESCMIFLHVRLREKLNKTMKDLFNANPLELLQDFDDHIQRRNWVRHIEDLRLERGEEFDRVDFLDIYRTKIHMTLRGRVKALIR